MEQNHDVNSKKGATRADAIKEITEKLEQGIMELMDSERYKSYLKTMSKFHNYSFNNTILIAMQRPDATLVAGYKTWEKQFERHVNRGEKGIKIMAPAPIKKRVEQDVYDPNTHRPVLGIDGKPKREEVEIVIPAFKPITVFDVSSTSGKELPSIGVSELTFSVEGYEDFVKALESIAPVPVVFEDIASGAKGYFSPSEQRIVVQKEMGEAQTVKTLIHEICHSLLDDDEHMRMEGVEIDAKRTRSDKEVTAESVAFTVANAFGIDCSEYSFSYITGWSSGKEIPEFKASMELIRQTASKLITDIEDALQEIQKEKSIEKPKDMYEIWQLKDEPDNRPYMFEDYEGMVQKDLYLEKERYEMVYAAPYQGESLEDIYYRFNMDYPDDFKGHSLSVSDVVVIYDAEGSSAHFVDSFGFAPVPDFLYEPEKTNEKSVLKVSSETNDKLEDKLTNKKPLKDRLSEKKLKAASSPVVSGDSKDFMRTGGSMKHEQ